MVTAARGQNGVATALIGKIGPVAIFDGAALRGQEGLVIDDATGTPGKGIRAVDSALAAIEQSLKSLGLYDSTDIIVSADHGFSTIDKGSQSSPAAAGSYTDTRAKELPPGFLAMDLTAALRKSDSTLQLFDPDDDNKPVDLKSAHPGAGNGIIGANGGSDLIYIPQGVADERARELGAQLVRALLEQDYVSRVLQESFREGGKSADVCTQTLKSQPGINGLATILKTQRVGSNGGLALLLRTPAP